MLSYAVICKRLQKAFVAVISDRETLVQQRIHLCNNRKIQRVLRPFSRVDGKLEGVGQRKNVGPVELELQEVAMYFFLHNSISGFM